MSTHPHPGGHSTNAEIDAGATFLDELHARLAAKRKTPFALPPNCRDRFGTADESLFGTRRAARRAGMKLVRPQHERSGPAERVALMPAGMPEWDPPMFIGSKVISPVRQF